MVESTDAKVNSQENIAEYFYSGALDRIRRFMLGIAPVLTAAAAWRIGIRCAVGFALGCLIAFVNFYWLKRAIGGFADRAAGATTSQSASGIVARFLLRYVLIAIGAYAILTASPASLNGLLAGLFLPVAAIFCEAGFEAYAALTRRI